ncbi:MAG: right-handed parallel beta-helix repeat-containing protein [Bacteroidota bacterium]
MKKLLTLFMVIPLFAFSQVEEVIPGGTQQDIIDAIANLNNCGTITIKGDINISSPIGGDGIPPRITLNFLSCSKLILTGSIALDIKGKIVSTSDYIFDVPTNHNLRIYNQEVYPEWFGVCSYQDQTVTDDVISLKKAITALPNGGTINFEGENYLINSDLSIDSNTSLRFLSKSKWEILGTTTDVDINGPIITELDQIFKTPVTHNLKIYNQIVYPEWFGLLDYQDASVNPNEERMRIQNAFDALPLSGEIHFTGKKYTVNNPIEINEGGIKVKGDGVYLSGSSLTNYITTTNNNGNVTPIFNINSFGFKISDFAFKSSASSNIKGESALGIALNFIHKVDSDTDGDYDQDDNFSKDLDASISNCTFWGFRYGIYGEGANLKITDNLFTACYIGVYINQAQTSIVADKANTRGHIIDRNRFHSIGGYLSNPSLDGSTAIKILGTENVTSTEENGNIAVPYYQDYAIRGYYNHITNNYADDCKTFFYGTVDRTKIEGNSIQTSGGTAISILGGLYGSISNNLIDGSFRWNAHQLFYSSAAPELPSGHGIQVEFAHHLTIHNNQIHNKRKHGIYIITSKNSSIQSNTIKNFNKHRYLTSSLGHVYGADSLNLADLPNYDAIEIQTNPSIYNPIYDGIHIKKDPLGDGVKYNIQNIVANNVIGISALNVEGRYGIYVGDGDDWNYVKNNFVNNIRLLDDIIIEQ